MTELTSPSLRAGLYVGAFGCFRAARLAWGTRIR